MNKIFSPWPVFHALRRLAAGLLCLLAASCLLPSLAQADVLITNAAGPLIRIGITPTGNLYAYHHDFAANLYYSSGNSSAAGWIVYDEDSGKLYGPSSVGAGGAMTGSAGYTPWTAVSQAAQTGSGTTADPYKITTTLASADGLTAVITVTYVVGDEVYSTSLQVTDSSGADRHLRLFVAADLYYGNVDTGAAVYDPATGSVGGVADGAYAGFTGFFVPLAPADHYYAGNFGDMWTQIGAHQLSDSVDAGSGIDIAAALQWNVTVAANGSASVEMDQLFSGDLNLLPPTLPGGVTGTPYSEAFTAFGAGVAPYTVTYLSGTLPPGLHFDSATATLSGTPTAAGTYSFTLHVADSSPAAAKVEKDFPYTVVITRLTPLVSADPAPVPTFGPGALLALILALGAAAAFGAQANARRRGR